MAQPTQNFDHVLIIGVGLLGASLGLALKRQKLATRITGVGRANSESLRIALERYAIDDTAELSAATSTADLIILCTPVRQFPQTLAQLAPLLKPGAIVTDVGSTKLQVMQWAQAAMPAHAHFVGSHPMAGSEKRGPEFARADLYDNALCLLCPAADAAATDTIDHFWQSIGMRTHRLAPQQHDQWVAAVSHLPHAVASSLMLTANDTPAALPAAAGGLIDTTRIAAGDVDMWTDILLTNPEPVAQQIAAFEKHLAHLRTAITTGDEKTIRDHLTRAKAARDAFMQQREQKT